MSRVYELRPVGVLRTCFKERFGVPRQAGLVPAAEAVLELTPPWDREEAFRGIDSFSHLWLLVVFHAQDRAGARPTVRPPRLGGNRRLGVFATRSPFRPNPLGLSVVRLEGVERRDGRVRLRLSGVDLVDGTPVLDVKPYLPYADCLPEAVGGFAAGPPPQARVRFAPPARRQLAALGLREGRRLRRLIAQVLAQDPRPPYLEGHPARRRFAMRLCELDVRWEVGPQGTVVVGVEPRSGT
jgi:tRNA-Thr(GGU) m(6)t(6)A37 methyltransferase TsaA